MEVNSAVEIYNIIRNKKIYIYGTGFAGKRFFHALQNKGMDGQAKAFVTTSGNGMCFCNREVQAINEILPVKDDEIICVAVAHAAFEEIKSKLTELVVNNYIWIFPCLNELLLGEMKQKSVPQKLKFVWRANRDRIGIAVRYLALEEFYGKNEIGYALYTKAMNLCSTETISAKRLNAYINMLELEKYEESKLNEPISLMENGLIVDGLHRTTVALFRGCKEIIGNVYPSSDTYTNEYLCLGNPLLITAEELGFTKDEIEAIIRVNNLLDARYM